MKNKTMAKHYRQGDVLLMEATKIPIERQTPGKIVTVAEGEATGHHHSILKNAIGYGDGKLADFIEVEKSTEIIHQEHDKIKLSPAKYMIGRQVEEGEDEEAQRVAD